MKMRGGRGGKGVLGIKRDSGDVVFAGLDGDSKVVAVGVWWIEGLECFMGLVEPSLEGSRLVDKGK